MKKILAFSFALLLALTLFSACSGGGLPEGVDADAAEVTAKEVIDAMNRQDYEELTALFREDLQDLVPPEAWQAQIAPALETFGAFESYGDVRFADKGETDYGHLFSAVVECQYANNTVTVEVVMDTDLGVTGLAFLQVK